MPKNCSRLKCKEHNINIGISGKIAFNVIFEHVKMLAIGEASSWDAVSENGSSEEVIRIELTRH